jgi:DNA-binding GntR family transcriptional regulator
MKTEPEAAELRNLMRGPDSGVPKYLRLRNALAIAIADGRWKAGGKIPTEERITEVTGLSLGTVQKALKTLADDGLIVRRQGRGSFVASGESPMNAPFYHCRFLDDEGQMLPIFSKFVRRRPAGGAGEWSRHLAGEILVLERVFSINNEFSIYTQLYFDALRLPALAKAPAAKLNGANLKDLITREQHVPLTRFSENLSVAAFPPHACAAIGVKPKTSGAVLEIVGRDRQGGAVYFQELFIPPIARRLHIAT